LLEKVILLFLSGNYRKPTEQEAQEFGIKLVEAAKHR
jgi:hypothetical protein